MAASECAPVVEETYQNTFTVVVVGTHRDPARLRADHARRLAKALWHAFGDQASVEGWEYDPLADDGEHEGHEAPIHQTTHHGCGT